MLAIPIPFVVAILIAVMLTLLLSRERSQRPAVELITFLVMAIVMSVLVGLRWSYGIIIMRGLLPICASTMPPLAWMTVNAMRRSSRSWLMRWLPLAVVVGGMLLLVFIGLPSIHLIHFAIDPIDVAMTTVDLGFGIAVFCVASFGPDGLDLARLGDASATQQAILGLGAALIFNGLIDVVIAARIENSPGSVGAIISAADLVILAAIAWATVLIGWNRPGTIVEAAEPANAERVRVPATSTEDLAVLNVVDELLRGRLLYHDSDLTLDRLGRRAGLPARAISAAINRMHQMNVSQYVNGFRVAEAQDLLVRTDRPITAILYEVGFQTKSNFNREFRRIAGCSPSEWRNSNCPTPN